MALADFNNDFNNDFLNPYLEVDKTIVWASDVVNVTATVEWQTN